MMSQWEFPGVLGVMKVSVAETHHPERVDFARCCQFNLLHQGPFARRMPSQVRVWAAPKSYIYSSRLRLM